jgi:DNA helicase-2/ATP-dependent DNA helicase PcrA
MAARTKSVSGPELLAGLNPEQRRAVTTTEGPLLVLAGAGSGKTRVITVRIAHLLERGVPPDAILAVTFTNKAAREMRGRLAKLAGARAKGVLVGTFHAFCLEILRRHGEHVGLGSRFTISDAGDQLSILRSVLRELHVGEASLQPSAVQARISLLKNRMAERAAFQAGAADDKDELVGRAWERYDERLRKTRSLDFDDVLLFARELLCDPRGPRGPRAELARRFRYLMVDEYQDTNGPQYEVVRAIAAERRNLCVVGDDDQSIYGWRGADVHKILSFERDFPGAAVVKLETNYRSTAPILEAANRVIRNNTQRHAKTLRSHLGPGEPLELVLAADETEEADHVARAIQAHVRRGTARLGDFAVLFRTGPQARPFETQFRARGVPYLLVGSSSFFDRKEVRDVVAYLRAVAHPEDELALLRVVDAPPRGLGKSSLDRILLFAQAEGVAPALALLRAREVAGLGAGAAAAAEGLGQVLETIRRSDAPVGERLRRLLDAVGYRGEVERNYPDATTRELRWRGVEEILELAEKHARRHGGGTFSSFLQELALEADDDPSPEEAAERDQVTLMTLHAAKGLEFPRVFLVGLEEGILPHARALAEDGVEEERRLCYVGITRAMRQLTLTLAKARSRHGHRMDTMPSRFLFEIKDEPPPKGWRAHGVEAPAAKSGRGSRAGAGNRGGGRRTGSRRR